jgi:hypothetical protein
MKNGTKFEELTAEIFDHLRKDQRFETVDHDVFLEGKDGPRQIDVLLKGNVGPIDILTIVECKDYNKNVNVTAIDALHSKMQDVNAHKAVLVARKGFTKTAIRKAKRLGISLCTAHSAACEKWKFNLEVPLVIVELSAEKYTPSFEFVAIENQTGIDFMNICGTPLPKIIAEYWNDSEIECKDGITEHIFLPNIPKPLWTTVPDGREIGIENLQVKMYLKKTYYLGYFNKVESAKYIEFIEENKRHVIFDPNDLSDYREKMAPYSKFEDIPQIQDVHVITVKLMHNPEAKFKFAEPNAEPD